MENFRRPREERDKERSQVERHVLRELARSGAEQAARSLRHLGAALDRVDVDPSPEAAQVARVQRGVAMDGATILRIVFARTEDPRLPKVEALLRWLEMPQAQSADRWARVAEEMAKVTS